MEKIIQSFKKKKNKASIEQMCGILLLSMQKNDNEKIRRELEGVLKNIREAEPCGHSEVRRIDKEIIANLHQINALAGKPESAHKILDLTAETGLLLVQRKVKVSD